MPQQSTRPVSGFTLRLVLEALKSAAGIQYARLVEQAGLARYATTLPPSDPKPAASMDELSLLFGGAFDLFGEHLARKTLKAFGAQIVPQMLGSPVGARLKAEAAKQHSGTEAAWWSQVMATTLSEIWTDAKAVEERGVAYVDLETCPTCARIRGARGAICFNTSTLYGGLGTALVGAPIEVVETECLAMGGTRCRFRVTRG